MVKQQVHEEFKTFRGFSLPELSKAVADYVDQNELAPKSLSVIYDNFGQFTPSFFASVGYRSDVAGYPVIIESQVLDPKLGVDEALVKAESQAPGDVICHSLFLSPNGELSVAFLLHE